MNPKPPGPRIRDWLLLGISVAFVAGGIFIAFSDPVGALFPLTFFSVCALTFGFGIVRKLRRRRFQATAVAVPGGVKLRGSNARMLLLAAMIGAPAVTLLLIPEPLSLLIWICATVMLGACAAILFGVFTGRIARRFLRFDPPGLTLGDARYEYTILWDQITDVEDFELHDNAVVGFDVLNPDAILVIPGTARPRLLKTLAKNKGFADRHVVIMAEQFAAQAESLCAAIRTYAANPEARAELVARPPLGSGPKGRSGE